MNAFVAESQVAEALNVSTRAIRLKAVQNDWPVKKTKKQGGNELFYYRDLLPVDIRKSLVETHVTTGASVPAVIHDRPVPKRSKEIGLAKYNLVHSFRVAKEQAGWGQKARIAQDFLLAYNAGVLMPSVYEVVGEIKERTLDALDKRLRDNNDDYLCLCDGRGGWRKHGTTKYKERQVSDYVKAILLKFYLRQERPTAIDAIRSTWFTLMKHGSCEKPGESTLRRWLRDYETWNAGVVCLAREGMKAYKDKYAPYITRDPELLEVGQCLVADGKTLNFFIRNPETGQPCRMTLIVFFDWKSRYPAGWQIAPSENQWEILAAFRNAVISLGRYPDSVYLDNGRAFKSKLFQGQGRELDFEDMTGLYARVGTAVYFAEPYNGRAKVVERFFHTVQGQLESKISSFCGDSIQTKPAHMHRNEKYHQALHKAETNNYIPTIREAAVIIDSYFKWYGQQPHTDISFMPGERFLAGRGPGIDAYQLHQDFLVPVDVHVRRGRVVLWKIEYESDAFVNIKSNLKLTARVNTADMRCIWCYTKDGDYIAEAYPVQACHPLARMLEDQVSVAQVEHQIKRQRRIVKNTKNHLKALAGLSGLENDCVDITDMLPFPKKSPVLAQPDNLLKPGKKEPQQISEKQTKRLEAITQKAREENKGAPKIQRPKFWESNLAHYEWCFEVTNKHGQVPCDDDLTFMNEFESAPEFSSYRQRFEDLKLVYNNNIGR